MAHLKPGTFRKFAIYDRQFDCVVVHADVNSSLYTVYQSNGLMRHLPFNSVVGKADVTPEQREIMLQIVSEYRGMLEANKLSFKYSMQAGQHSYTIERLQAELGYSKDI